MSQPNTIAPYPPSPERKTTDEFERARRELYQVIGDVEEAYLENGTDPDTVSRGNYWLAVAENATRRVNEKYSTAENMTYGMLLRLTANAPAGFMAQRMLQRIEHPSYGIFTQQDRERRQNLAAITSHRNDLIATYARAHEELTASDLNAHLTTTLEKTLEYPEQVAHSAVAPVVRGLQHEVAMGYVLASGIETRITSEAEDLEGGDYVVRLDRWHGVMVDIKSSTHKTRAEDSIFDDWTIKHGCIVLASPLDDQDLEGKFYPSEAALKRKAPTVMQSIRLAVARKDRLRKVPMV